MNTSPVFFNKNLFLLILCQGLYLTNNVTFIAINGLVGFSLTPIPWMATLPVMSYVVGAALSTSLVAKVQAQFGRKRSFQFALLIASLSTLLCAYAAYSKNFWLLTAGTAIAGYYSANGLLYRFVAPELTHPNFREKAVSLVLAGILLAVATIHTRSLFLAIGLHAGWILGQQGIQILGKFGIKPSDRLLPWVGENVVSGAVPTGLLPLVVLGITGVLIFWFLRYARCDGKNP
jgi:predicted MFS family arabinose efflux permease